MAMTPISPICRRAERDFPDDPHPDIALSRSSPIMLPFSAPHAAGFPSDIGSSRVRLFSVSRNVVKDVHRAPPPPFAEALADKASGPSGMSPKLSVQTVSKAFQ